MIFLTTIYVVTIQKYFANCDFLFNQSTSRCQSTITKGDICRLLEQAENQEELTQIDKSVECLIKTKNIMMKY